MKNINLFHVHTKRCKHAAGEDYQYIEKAISLNANSITFLDHAPFPGNPFGNRMKYEELDEYIYSINNLAEKYKENIKVICGLEIEYFPNYEYYYKALKSLSGLNCLALGQHMYELEKDIYSFSLKDKTLEYEGLSNAIISGIKTGYFDVVVHPDRIFKNNKKNNLSTEELSKAANIIKTARNYKVLLEVNKSSIDNNMFYKQFWDIVPKKQGLIYGIDAHSLEDMVIFDKL